MQPSQISWKLAAVSLFATFNLISFATAGEKADSIGASPTALRQWLLQKVDDAAKTRNAEIAKLTTAESIAARQRVLREKFAAAIGVFPERTPLNATITGTLKRDGYRVEKILFESRPKFFVTAALFLPDETRHAPPWPGILVPCGHSANGKAMDPYQRGAALAALNGMAALVFDPIEQGERGRGSVKGHNAIGLPAVLVGISMAQIEIWDGMRAIDYLQSRGDILKDRIGCMGNSGGGTQTAYLLALDDRIQAAAPACYITSLPHVTRAIGPQDAEQNIFGQLSFGMDHADYLTMRAPIPVLIAAAIQDFFPIAGARGAHAEAQKIFATLGHADRISMVEHDGKHGWAKPMREASVRWMNRWLSGIDAPVLEPETLAVLSEKEIQVTEHGDVMKLPDARSPFDVIRDLRVNLPRPPQRNNEELAGAVSRAASIRDAVNRPALSLREQANEKRKPGSVARILFDLEGMPIPALLYLPAETKKSMPVLLADSEGKQHAKPVAEKLAAEGHVVLSVDLRGFGETANTRPDFYSDLDGGSAFIAYLLGSSLVGQRAEEVLALASWLAAEQKTAEVELIAVGRAATPALHAAVVESRLFSRVVLRDSPRSWLTVVEKGGAHSYSDIIHSGLAEYDPNQLKAALGQRLIEEQTLETKP